MTLSGIQKPVKQAKLSDVILRQLEALILEGSLQAGEKLPPERELAKQFDVSRPSLREAIQKLEAKGLVNRRQGGGTFVSDKILSGLSDPLFELMSQSNESQFDLLEFRHGIEGMSSYYAAMRGTEADFAEIEKKHENIGTAQLENNLRSNLKSVCASDDSFGGSMAGYEATSLNFVSRASWITADSVMKTPSMTTTGSIPLGTFFKKLCGLSP